MRELQPGLESETLAAPGALWTSREIAQQPAMLRQTRFLLEEVRPDIDRILKPLLSRPDLKMILTGAGSSAFIGECLAPWLASVLPCYVEAIASTDIVSAPRLYLRRQTPTLLVSFARSGNSPESVAAARFTDRFVAEAHHLVITCNPQGALAAHARSVPGSLLLLLPEATHDKSFAMTSSLSCMTYAALGAFSKAATSPSRIEAIARATEAVIEHHDALLRQIAGCGYERVVYLGSHIFRGLAQEAALKLLELTDGSCVAAFDSPLGFRHGPKTIVNQRTLVVLFLSNDPGTRPYDLDLLEELKRDGLTKRLLVISAQDDVALAGLNHIRVPCLEDAGDVDLIFPYVVVPQLLALHSSLHYNLSPDNPNRTGTVNRVVKGVRIHPPVDS